MDRKINFRNAMAYMGSAVNIITTSGSDGNHGFTASAVCSVTDTPPTLLVCMNQSSALHKYFIKNKFLAVNVLKADQKNISKIFANPQIERDVRFSHAQWTTSKTGSPLLVDALVNFDCQIIQTQHIGSHTIFYAEILDSRILASQNDRKGLIYFGRNYHDLNSSL